MNIDKLEAMLARGQDSALLRLGLATAYLETGQPAPAIEHLQHCLVQDAHYTAAWKLLGKAQLAAGSPSQARCAWLQGLAVSRQKGDRQAEKEIGVFLKRLARQASSE